METRSKSLKKKVAPVVESLNAGLDMQSNSQSRQLSHTSSSMLRQLQIEANIAQEVAEIEREEADSEVARKKAAAEAERLAAEAEAVRQTAEAAKLAAEAEAARCVADAEAEASKRKGEARKHALQKKMELEIALSSRSNVSVQSLKESVQSAKEKVNEWLDKSEFGTCSEEPGKSNIPVINSVGGETNKLLKGLTKATETMTSTIKNLTDKKDNSRIILRHMLEKNIPIFDGKAEEWPAFKLEFIKSTTCCGFSDLENISRLQKMLRGRAKIAVETLLVDSKNVDKVMEILERRFGRPDQIIEVLIHKIKLLPAPKEYRPELILEFSDSVNNLVATIESVGYYNHLTNPQLLKDLAMKLSIHMRFEWGRFISELEDPRLVTLKEFAYWLSTYAHAASYMIPFSSVSSSTTDKRPGYQKETVLTTTIKKKVDDKVENFENKEKCCVCAKLGHYIKDCKVFLDKAVDERWKIVCLEKVCFCCLKTGHRMQSCQEKRVCGVDGCKRFHFKLLHVKRQPSEEVVGHAHEVKQHTPRPKVLLRVIPVTVSGPKGQIETFAMLDDGSTVTLIDEGLANKIGATGPTQSLNLNWTANKTYREEKSRCIELEIKGTTSSVYKLDNVRTVKNLKLPSQTVKLKNLEQWNHLKQLAITELNDANPLLLIGQDNIDLIITRQVIEGAKNAPIASLTRLGWVVHGRSGHFRQRAEENFLYLTWSDESLLWRHVDSLLRKCFVGEKTKKKAETNEDKYALSIMENTCKHLPDGHW